MGLYHGWLPWHLDSDHDPLMASGDSTNLFHWFHLLWVGAVGVFWKLWNQVETKADKNTVDQKHADNTKRLDYIIEKIDDMAESITRVRIDVANLKGRGGYNNGES